MLPFLKYYIVLEFTSYFLLLTSYFLLLYIVLTFKNYTTKNFLKAIVLAIPPTTIPPSINSHDNVDKI
jgi:hypothetical protein